MTAISPPIPTAAGRQKIRREPPAMLAAVADRGSLRPLGDYDGCGVLGAWASLDGLPVLLYATDPSVRGGALGAAGCERIVEAIHIGLAHDLPIVGLWNSGGAALQEGVESLDAVGRVFAAIVAASGRVPQVSIVDGPAAGGAAYGPALTDVVIFSDEARAFVTGPRIVHEVTGQVITARQLGGPELHDRHSGVAHLSVDTLADARDVAAGVLDLLTRPGTVRLDALETISVDPSRHVPREPRRVYQALRVVDDLLDAPALVLQPRWAANVLTALGRIAGRAVGIVANDPWRIGGCLDAEAGDKAARFVRLCDAFGVPLVVLVDVPGYLPGEQQERAGVLRRGAKLLHAFAAASVPRVTVHVRKAYGGAFVAMNSRGLGASRVLAWPSAEVGIMNDASAVGIIHRRRLAAAPEAERSALHTRLVAEHRAHADPLRQCLDNGLIDEVVAPRGTRRAIAEHLASAPVARGSLSNIPL